MDGALVLKLLTAFATPLGFALLLALLGLLLRRRRLVLLALAWLWLWSTPWAALRLAQSLEGDQAFLPASQLPAADAIVLLGGALGPRVPGWRPEPNLTDAGDRLSLAQQLLAAGKAPRLLYSGGSFSGQRPVEAEDGVLLLRQWGVSADRLTAEPLSRTTRENAAYSLPILRDWGVKRVLLVSSGWHLPRAMRNFQAAAEREGLHIEFIPAACDPVEIFEAYHPLMRYLPSTGALDTSRRLFKEYLGLLHARLFGA